MVLKLTGRKLKLNLQEHVRKAVAAVGASLEDRVVLAGAEAAVVDMVEIEDLVDEVEAEVAVAVAVPATIAMRKDTWQGTVRRGIDAIMTGDPDLEEDVVEAEVENATIAGKRDTWPEIAQKVIAVKEDMEVVVVEGVVVEAEVENATIAKRKDTWQETAQRVTDVKIMEGSYF